MIKIIKMKRSIQNRSCFSSLIVLFSAALIWSGAGMVQAQIQVIPNQPNPTPSLLQGVGTNRFYLSNRAPLVASPLIELPIGAVRPKGWLRVYFERQRDGLTGNLGNISAWLQKENNAWLNKDGKGEFGWEEVPYWLRGYMQLAYLLEDKTMIKECHVWIEAAIQSQRADGDFGPAQTIPSGARDYWANMLMLYCLQTYYERTNDHRVIDLMTKYFKYQLALPDDRFLADYWQHMRGGDTLYIVHWLYNITGDKELLKFGDKIHRRTANWSQHDTLPDWHNVNIAQAFREPATYYRQTKNYDHLQASYDVHNNVRKLYGQVPGGMFGSDEVARPGYSDPRQAVETCGLVEQMFSDGLMLTFTGDAAWGDHCEDVAFNMYPAAVMPDFKSLRYLTAPNLVVSDSKNHAPGLHNSGPFLMMNPFSSRCCQHNHSMGWPYFVKHLWLATPDNGLCAAVYGPSEVTAKVGDGMVVTIVEDTVYPFEDKLRFKVKTKKPARFPLYFRIPKWCSDAKLLVNGKPSDAHLVPGLFARIEREWNDGDAATLELPMQVSLRTWEKNHKSVSVDYGPLTFSLKIAERLERKESDATAIGDSRWQKGVDKHQWPSFEIHPASPWNYGLEIDAKNPLASFKVEKRKWPKSDFPFTLEDVPISMTVNARRIPEWQLDKHELCAPLQESPAISQQKLEIVTLVPMGAARLRISSFPTIGGTNASHLWVAPKKPVPAAYKTSASHSFQGDTMNALSDGLLPAASNDESVPRFTFWPHKGGAEWVQYDFDTPRSVTEVGVYWFDDTGKGECRVPKSWRVMYPDGDSWRPVVTGNVFNVTVNKMNLVSFDAITTKSLRVMVELQTNYSGGILECHVK